MPGNHNASEKEEIWDRLIHSRTNDKRLSGLVKFQPVHLVKIQPVRTDLKKILEQIVADKDVVGEQYSFIAEYILCR
jgi:hypothetical protein